MTVYKPEDLAAELGVERRWVIEHLHLLPHQRYSKRVIRFEPDDVAEIKARFRRRPVEEAEGQETPGLSARSRAHLRSARGSAC